MDFGDLFVRLDVSEETNIRSINLFEGKFWFREQNM